MILTMGSFEIETELISPDSCQDVITISDRDDREILDIPSDVEDISSEEESLIMQRIKILENFNSILEKKQAKRSCKADAAPHISASSESCKIPELDNVIVIDDVDSPSKPVTKNSGRFKRKITKRKRKTHNHPESYKKPLKSKKRDRCKTAFNSSSDSDLENTVQKRILRKVVSISSTKPDKSSLKSRLLNMINNPQPHPRSNINKLPLDNGSLIPITIDQVTISEEPLMNLRADCLSDEDPDMLRQLALKSKSTRLFNVQPENMPSPMTEVEVLPQDNSKATENVDSDIEELRLIALKSAIIKKAMERKKERKTLKRRNSRRSRASISSMLSDEGPVKPVDMDLDEETNHLTDLEAVDVEIDMDTGDYPVIEENNVDPFGMYLQTPTDYFSQQMMNPPEYPLVPLSNYPETYPFVNEKCYANDYSYYKMETFIQNQQSIMSVTPLNETDVKVLGQEEVDDDEDMLRAQLLTSISKQVPSKLAEIPIADVADKPMRPDSGLIIRLGESDMESECEETKNLRIMHMKLEQESQFQKNLEEFLRNARREAEKTESQSPSREQLPTENIRKHTPMAVNHLPKSDRQEYRQLVNRIAELEKVKLLRQQALNNSIAKQKKNNIKITISQINDTRNIQTNSIKNVPQKRIVDGPTSSIKTIENNIVNNKVRVAIEQKILLSRQNITNELKMVQHLRAEESTLQAKAELQVVQMRALAAALRVSRSALAQNQQAQMTRRNNLARLKRLHHSLLNRYKTLPAPIKDSDTTLQTLSSELQQRIAQHSPLNVLSHATKIVKEDVISEKIQDMSNKCSEKDLQKGDLVKPKLTNVPIDPLLCEKEASQNLPHKSDTKQLKETIMTNDEKINEIPEIPHMENNLETSCKEIQSDTNVVKSYAKEEYRSPLEALNSKHSWKDDTEAIFCPFEVGGSCKDTNCKYFHPKS